VNQLTLLVGSMTGVYSLSAGELMNLPLNDMQSTEFLLTAATSLLALVLVIPRIIGWKSGLVLLALFLLHLPFVDQSERQFFTYIYLGIAVVCGSWYLYLKLSNKEEASIAITD
ncbi:MAG: hypothetical protein VX478_06235, partial [Chloroflexota bacterium]|nr:hypothetical protein [Chloroflexota bacterium]